MLKQDCFARYFVFSTVDVIVVEVVSMEFYLGCRGAIELLSMNFIQK